jgi:hypothetical protein
MSSENKVDRFDEIMRTIYLDQVKSMDAEQLQQALFKVQSGNSGDVASDHKERIITRLTAMMHQLSFGQLLQEAMQQQNIAEPLLVENTGLTPFVIDELKSDGIYPNNVPIQLFKKLVMTLKLSYSNVKAAALKTVSLLKQQAVVSDVSGYTPAFRKGHEQFSGNQIRKSHDSDGKELFENEEALNKYLNRLEELMNE